MRGKGGRAAVGLDLAGLVGNSLEEALRRLGPPDADRRVGSERWLIYDRGEYALRIRCARARAAGAGNPRRESVASWSVSFREGHRTLRDAASAVGLWPNCAPDESADRALLLRRPLRDADTGVTHSLTATVRGDRISQLTAFDEPPEWIPVDKSGEA